MAEQSGCKRSSFEWENLVDLNHCILGAGKGVNTNKKCVCQCVLVAPRGRCLPC